MNESPSFIHSTNLKALRVWLTVLLTGLALCGPAIAEPVKTIYSTVDLIAEQATLPSSGGKVTVGLYLEPDPTWHAYWINPGDAGLPASISWSLPEGFEAGELQFPAPHIIPFVDLITYGFDDPILLLTDIVVPAGLSPGEMVELQGQVRWVVCDDKLCVPESTVLSVSLPVGDGDNDVRQAGRFAAARSKVPRIRQLAGAIRTFERQGNSDHSDARIGIWTERSLSVYRFAAPGAIRTAIGVVRPEKHGLLV